MDTLVRITTIYFSQLNAHVRKKSHTPFLRGQLRSPWLLTTAIKWDDPPSRHWGSGFCEGHRFGTFMDSTGFCSVLAGPSVDSKIFGSQVTGGEIQKSPVKYRVNPLFFGASRLILREEAFFQRKNRGKQLIKVDSRGF